jgi:hypothetical protein
MPAASAPEAASIAAAGPRLESANAAAAKDELSDRDDVKLAEEKAAGKILGGLGDKPSPGSGGFGGAFDFRAKHLAGARPMAAKEQARDLAEEKLDKSPADKQERPWAEERRAGTGEMSPGIDWVERSNEPLYWEPQLQTDAEGRASLRFSLPSNIPAYRVSIDAHANGRIGHVHENFNARSR